ncbi:Glycosyltransferase involved in cell wall bisynthesis [Flavobacterium xueshanense]|uniref:Glycosyltransferase involved in cell wall bisynthesis n=1 Tax=Flavobacterium xueshanense TaxID=935223 RepID=A0A1I2GFY3_9FLAO|nr:Glycosyltransferase involved in cell wall bisynthesis [Flavobacterium xueshanense]
MKILMVSMASLHFFKWAEQLENAGHEVYWFDVIDSKQKVSKISWINQIVDWRLRWNYPGRYFMKNKFPRLYDFVQKFNERNTAIIFEHKLLEIEPDVVHSFEMQISCLPILSVMEKYNSVNWVFSSWGSDMFFTQQLQISDFLRNRTLKRINYLITDCFRDFEIAKKNGFTNQFLGVFPGNGGIYFEDRIMLPVSLRKIILIKGYNNCIGKGINIIKALTKELLVLMKNHEIIVFGADHEIQDYINNQDRFKEANIRINLRSDFIENNALLKMMGESYIYIGNSMSDGLPNSMIEAMGMGAFPIQSNPGNVTEELIIDGYNGLLIQDALNYKDIERLIKKALLDPAMIEKAFEHNTKVIKERYDRDKNKIEIIKLYESISKI